MKKGSEIASHQLFLLTFYSPCNQEYLLLICLNQVCQGISLVLIFEYMFFVFVSIEGSSIIAVPDMRSVRAEDCQYSYLLLDITTCQVL